MKRSLEGILILFSLIFTLSDCYHLNNGKEDQIQEMDGFEDLNETFQDQDQTPQQDSSIDLFQNSEYEATAASC